MLFNKKLTGKVLDPIHGIIRLTELELKIIDHPLFQRLRNIKQNTFLYKVFPSAMHSRFEHSLGVMHLAYEILDNMSINVHRYQKKYHDSETLFSQLEMLPESNIQELRLAALMHDVGHGPMSHQFDSFMCDKQTFQKILGDRYTSISSLIHDESPIEHEHISLLFASIIYDSLPQEQKDEINIDNVLAMIDKNYKQNIHIVCNGEQIDILPLFTSIISSCPIDADRMDYLLRDSYFSGVKCGIYDHNRLFMSMVPVIQDKTVFLAYKESGLDSIVEFINARANLFGQVYYHKTNRSFSSMLSKVCELTKETKHDAELFSPLLKKSDPFQEFQSFYQGLSDDHFLTCELKSLTESDSKTLPIITNIIERKPWKKIYESKHFLDNIDIAAKINRNKINELKSSLVTLVTQHNIDPSKFTIDVMTDNAFKDIDKTEIKLLEKQLDGTYQVKDFKESNDKLSKFQTIKCFIRIFSEPSISHQFTPLLLQEIQRQKEILIANNALIQE